MPEMSNRSMTSQIVGMLIGAGALGCVAGLGLMVTGVVLKIMYLGFMIGWNLL